MISLNEVLNIHQVLISRFGGRPGVRDIQLLESALQRPFQTFEGKELYQTPLEKAAALTESLLRNHPFIDGNKRVAYTTLRLFLKSVGYTILADQENKYQFIISVASGELGFEEIHQWILTHTKG
jgi:death-on-curing protein